MTCAPNEDSDQPGHPSAWRSLGSLATNWARSHFVGFVMLRILNLKICITYLIKMCIIFFTRYGHINKFLKRDPLEARKSAMIIEPRRDKTNKMSVRPAKTPISLGIHPVWSVFAVRMKKAWVLSYPLSAQRRLWSDWAHSDFVSFVMSRLMWLYQTRCYRVGSWAEMVNNETLLTPLSSHNRQILFFFFFFA